MSSSDRAIRRWTVPRGVSHPVMISSMEQLRRRPARLGLLLGLVVLPVLLLESASLLEVHASDTPGIFNEEHVWAAGAAVKAEGPLPGVPFLVFPLPTAAAAPAAPPGDPQVSPLRHADSRAPPTR